ncbi:hypothetical protein NE865_05373 [Phthorimaea operculella]|nr:hypothetical protein NE865_05373 [Phthorimaea operculella]
MRTKITLWAVENTRRAGNDAAMDGEKKITLKRPSVLKKLNAENLLVIERGLIGELPDRLKPNYVPFTGPVRGNSNELVAAKPTGFLSSCLPVIPDSPTSEGVNNSDSDGSQSPLRKSFSFRQKISRISFLKKRSSEKPKWKSIVEDEKGPSELEEDLAEQDLKSKRFWHFRNKEMMEKKSQSPIYKRSKSFEFLPRALNEGATETVTKKQVKNTNSFADSIGDAWGSNDSLEYIANNVYYDDNDGVFLKSIKEISPDSSKQSSTSNVTSASAVTSASVSSGMAANIFNRDSVQNLLDEFDKAVELFSENYASDCEPYTKTEKESKKEKRKSASFSTLPSPKVIQVPKVSEVSEDFKTELSKMLSERRASAPEGPRVVYPVGSARRGSVTDWFVLEEFGTSPARPSPLSEANKYQRAKAKPQNRVRRMSSTKYAISKAKLLVSRRSVQREACAFRAERDSFHRRCTATAQPCWLRMCFIASRPTTQ